MQNYAVWTCGVGWGIAISILETLLSCCLGIVQCFDIYCWMGEGTVPVALLTGVTLGNVGHLNPNQNSCSNA